jgi:hypothetical protein
MSINTAPSVTAPMDHGRRFDPAKVGSIALWVGGAGIALSILGFFFYSSSRVSLSWLISVMFWLSIGLGMLFMVMIHHIFDAGWSTILRRPLEHGLASLPWIGLLFAPLILISLFYGEGGLIWKWMASDLPPVAGDVLYQKKSAYLNNSFFVIRFILFFGIWIGLAWAFRKASFSQDVDGASKWTSVSRKLAAAGLILGALTVSFASMDWIKSLDYHWFSTMFGVWFFSGSMRAALAVTLIICVVLVKFGPFEGIFKQSHMYELGRLMLAFTIFWAYISFSQYFLILNANIPEETFWYVTREEGNWWNVGLVLIFCNFFVPFVFLLFYPSKVNNRSMVGISIWILFFHLIDLYYYILPSKLVDWIPVYNFPIFDVALFWDVAALAGVGGICVWAFLRSLTTQSFIPVRDPRILESVNHHG